MKNDFLIIGSGLAGLYSALKLAEIGSVALVTKLKLSDSNTNYAQGGIACVVNDNDSFEDHISDTIRAGGSFCKEDIVKQVVNAGPEVINELISLGIKFTKRDEIEDINSDEYDLGKEGGHTKRRVLHSGDITGNEIVRALISQCLSNKNISIYENHIAIDLISNKKGQSNNQILGAYVIDKDNNSVKTFSARETIIATGGAGKVYLYTSNPDVACGAGIAMAYRAGAEIANMEFFQFHPTILYHPDSKSFLISEAVRGEGGVLKRYNKQGELIEFMDNYHEMKSLAPRDVVAKAIDNELKTSGEESVYIDIRDKSEEFLKKRFPNIFQKCLDYGINMSKDLIPVVPAAHYSCGGVKTDINGWTGLKGLYAIGEVANTGVHGANRLASNSLLETAVIAKFAANKIKSEFKEKRDLENIKIEDWKSGNAKDSDELVVISHNWDEIRRFMWDYVGIVRTNKRLERAKHRIENIKNEIDTYYWDFNITPDLVELRNIANLAEIIILSALKRKESRGLHYNLDYPERKPELDNIDTIIKIR